MPRPPKILSEHPGHGAVPAERHHTAIVRYRLFLNRGDEIFPSRRSVAIDLSDRRTMPGLRYGILGMRTGGRREFRIPAHLAFGEDGLPDEVPPHAVIRCDLELLDLQEPGATERSPHLDPPLPRLLASGCLDPEGKTGFSLSLDSGGEGEHRVCWADTAEEYRQGRVRQRLTSILLPPATAARFIAWVDTAPAQHPAEFLSQDRMHSETLRTGSRQSTTRYHHPQTGPCWISLWIHDGSYGTPAGPTWFLRPDSPALLHSELWQWLQPLLAEKLALGPPLESPGQTTSELPPAP